MPLSFHPYADMFPLIEGEQFAEFVADVRANDLREKIVIFDGKILDGRNRYCAALAAGLIDEDDGPDRAKYFVRFVPSVDGDPLSFVLSKNIHRRHLSIGQRAYTMAEYERFRHGGARKQGDDQDANLRLDGALPEEPQETRADLADKGHVSERSIASAATVRDHGTQELKTAVKQAALPISVAEKIARLPETEQPAEIAKHLPNGARSIMGSRQEPDDSLDFFPTPPWATRALVERVLFDHWHIPPQQLQSAWEPACGEGHMAAILGEYFEKVRASDIFDHGYGDVVDFLALHGPPPSVARPDWIITNPPFNDKSEAFVIRALQFTRVGVAMFLRLQWLETVGRYDRIFKPHPPALIAQFAERVPLCKGRWNPNGDTATAYLWLIWFKAERSDRTEFIWIPPGQREALTRPDDAERFTAHPVIKRSPTEAPPSLVEPAESVPSSPEDAGSSNVSEEVQ